METESISMKAKYRKLWGISKYMFEEQGRFSEKTIAGKIVKIERTSAESGLKHLLSDIELLHFLKNIRFEIGERYYFEFDAIGSYGDHVHLFVGTEPKYSPSKVMQTIISITARQILKQYSEIKKHLWGGELYSDGGYIGM